MLKVKEAYIRYKEASLHFQPDTRQLAASY